MSESRPKNPVDTFKGIFFDDRYLNAPIDHGPALQKLTKMILEEMKKNFVNIPINAPQENKNERNEKEKKHQNTLDACLKELKNPGQFAIEPTQSNSTVTNATYQTPEASVQSNVTATAVATSTLRSQTAPQKPPTENAIDPALVEKIKKIESRIYFINLYYGEKNKLNPSEKNKLILDATQNALDSIKQTKRIDLAISHLKDLEAKPEYKELTKSKMGENEFSKQFKEINKIASPESNRKAIQNPLKKLTLWADKVVGKEKGLKKTIAETINNNFRKR